MSLEPGSGSPPPSGLAQIFTESTQRSAQDEALAALERENQALKDARLEERFCWIVFSIILFDMAVFSTVQATGVPIAILFLQLLLIIVLARKCGVEQIVRFIDKILDGWMKRGSDLPSKNDQ